MYYYGARYYDPRISVWMSVDPLAEKYPSTSSYMHCLGNPINLIDSDGRSSGRFTDWFENETTGEIMNIKGTSQLPKDMLYRGWENIGKDDKFGKQNIPKGSSGTITKMNAVDSKEFMKNQGYKLVDKQLFVYDKSATEKILAGKHSNSLVTGELVKIS